MAKCDLRFEFAPPSDGSFAGGQTVQGTLHVTPAEDITCKLLTITHHWETHGRGNIDTGGGTPVELHPEKLLAGQHYQFDFAVKLAPWPPTYHGHYLNVDHELRAQVHIPWGFDVTEAFPFTLHTSADAAIDPSQRPSGSQGKSTAGCIAVSVLGLLLLVGTVLLIVPVIIFTGLIAIFLGLGWFFWTYLPKRRVGQTKLQLETLRVAAGQPLRGTFRMEPPKRLRCNGVSAKLTAAEVCVSGSGSNRRTHRHTVHDETVALAPPGNLPAGSQSFPIEFLLPEKAAPTLKLGSNSLEWKFQLRIDIPGWPDFTTDEQIIVCPHAGNIPHPGNIDTSDDEVASSTQRQLGEPTRSTMDRSDTVQARTGPAQTDQAAPTTAATHTISFGETASFLKQAEHDHQQINRIVDAIRGLEFPIQATIDRTTLYSGREDQAYAYADGRIALGTHVASGLQLTLYMPASENAALAERGEREWDGRGTVMGYDFQHDRLQIRVPQSD